MSEKKTFGGVVVNDLGHILPYTVQGTVSQCEEHAVERWGPETWKKLQELGAYVSPCEIVLIPKP